MSSEAEINATLAKAHCAESRGEVPDSAYTFEAMPRTRLVRFTRADGEGSSMSTRSRVSGSGASGPRADGLRLRWRRRTRVPRPPWPRPR